MKHIIFGGDGFVGRYLARDLQTLGEEVVICDIRQSDLPIYPRAQFVHTDITDLPSLEQAPVGADDIVYNMAARMLHPIVSRRERKAYFFSVDYQGAANVIDLMGRRGCNKLIQFSTDMVYGFPLVAPPIRPDHPRNPIGEYADSKRVCEDLCMQRRVDGLDVSIFRPRLIIGPGRLGILTNLFRCIERHLPVPLIGDGSNRYQMISVFDCASAALLSAQKGVVNGEFNLGSKNPPSVRELLGKVIEAAGSRSFLVSTPAGLVKRVLAVLDVIGLSLLVPEQYEIADTDFIVDIESTERKLGWVPQYDDATMLMDAYREYQAGSRNLMVEAH
jgi:nucleoside-diphosphate-sugar epimerase